MVKKWTDEQIFILPDVIHQERRLTARQVKYELEHHHLGKDEPLYLRGLPGKHVTAGNICRLLESGACYKDVAKHAIETSELTFGSPPLIEFQPDATTAAEYEYEDTELRSEDDRLSWWESVLTKQATYWVLIAYCIIGFGFNFFISGNPELSLGGIALGILGSLLKITGLSLLILFLFSAAANAMHYKIVGWLLIGIVGLGTIFFATGAYIKGYHHLQTNQFASIANLTEQCMKDSIRRGGNRIGAKCNDGWDSRATRSGACSSHQGVAYWQYLETQTKTLAQCKLLAQRQSWR